MLERELYETVETFLNVEFSAKVKPSLGEHLAVVAITAMEGSALSGMWSRPDLALASLHRRKFQNTVQLDLYGFEVKRDGACNLSSVHEALAQRRFVNFSYLVWQYTKADFGAANFLHIKASCEAYGIGLISFSDTKSGRSFVTHIKALRGDPDPNIVDAFIEDRFPEQKQQRLLTWLRGV